VIRMFKWMYYPFQSQCVTLTIILKVGTVIFGILMESNEEACFTSTGNSLQFPKNPCKTFSKGLN